MTSDAIKPYHDGPSPDTNRTGSGIILPTGIVKIFQNIQSRLRLSEHPILSSTCYFPMLLCCWMATGHSAHHLSA